MQQGIVLVHYSMESISIGSFAIPNFFSHRDTYGAEFSPAVKPLDPRITKLRMTKNVILQKSIKFFIKCLNPIFQSCQHSGSKFVWQF